MNKYFLIFLLSAVSLLFLFAYQTSSLSDKRLHAVFCNVGQGDAIYIRTPGGVDILVDGGPSDLVLKCLERNMPFWDKTLELVFATHPDADHITGLVDVIKRYNVNSFNTVRADKNTAIFRKLKEVILDRRIAFREILRGDKFVFSDGAELQTLWPQKGFESGETNDYSLVQLLKYKDFDLLLTGDIESEILDTFSFGFPIEVLKLPHHGSKTGVDQKTFENSKFNLAVISAGKNNSYHHPHPSVLNLLKKYNVQYKRTDLEGEIDILTDGEKVVVKNFQAE